MRAIILPEVDAPLIARNANKYRSVLAGFIPKVGLSIIDYERVGAIDHFYRMTQCHRDYYKDPTGKLRPVADFDVKFKKFASPPDSTSVYTAKQLRYVREMRPGGNHLKYETYSLCTLQEPTRRK